MGLSVHLYCDGASRGNPGRAAYGFVILAQNQLLDRKGAYIGITTNNVAEYQGLVNGLRRCQELKATDVTVRSDSQLLVRQLNGEYRIKSTHLKPLYEEAVRLLKSFSKSLVIHIPREENELADAEANAALDSRL